MANENTFVKDAGAWKMATAIHVRDAGVWKPVKGIWTHDGGVWKKVYFKSFRFNHTYSSDTASPSMATLATSLGWNGSDPVVGNVVVAANLYSNHINTNAFYCHGLPAGSVINLTVNAGKTIGGRGGDGAVAMGTASNGGNGLYVRNLLNIVNHGVIAGGGGGGGGGANVDNPAWSGCGGGGGRGWSNGGPPQWSSLPVGYAGGGGTFASAGLGGSNGSGRGAHAYAEFSDSEGNVAIYEAYSGVGGNGGDWGQAGQPGGAAENVRNATITQGPGNGGAGGWAVDGNSFVTWLVPGTRFGHLGN